MENSRKNERKNAFFLVFMQSFDADNAPLNKTFDTYLENFLDEGEALNKNRVLRFFEGVFQNLEAIDAMIEKYSKGWRVTRLARVDLALLRLAIFELIFADVNAQACINGAVELAKIYGAKDSYSFINGILGNITKGELNNETKSL